MSAYTDEEIIEEMVRRRRTPSRDPLEDEIEWKAWTADNDDLVIEGALGSFSKRKHISMYNFRIHRHLKDDARREIAHDLLQAVYEGREREKREADKQFVGAV